MERSALDRLRAAWAKSDIRAPIRISPLVDPARQLGYSRLIWGRFVVHQDLQSVLRCHIAALEAIGGVPHEILYDRMKTAVIGEDADGLVVYNRALVDLARHYGFQPRACRPYRPKTKGKVERPFRYIREDFFLGNSFRNLDDLNAQLRHRNPRRHCARIERGEMNALEAIDALLTEELTLRENRRVKMALVMARLSAIKTLAGFDFSFQPSLDRNRIMALAELQFIDRAEVLHLIGPPGTGKSHLSLALGVEAVKAGRSVYFGTLADIIGALAKAEREGALREKIRFFCRFALFIVDEIGYLPVIPGGGNLFFQLVNARYEKGAMILTSNRAFFEWGHVFGDPVVATALLDHLLHHAIVIQIEGASYRLREHADLVPENIRSKSLIQPSPIPPTLKRRGRPPKNGGLDQHHG